MVGIIGGGLLLVGIALALALTAPQPALSPSAPDTPDLRVTLSEDFLNRFAKPPAQTETTVRVDLLPGNKIQLVVDTVVETLGVAIPVRLIGLLEVRLTGQTLEAHLIETQVEGLSLPVELTNVFEEDIGLINHDLQGMVDDLSQTLGTSIIITNLSTSDSQLQLDVREVR